MPDQSERVILEVEEGPSVQRSVRSANAGLESVEKTAARAAESVGRNSEQIVFKTLHVVDQSRNSIERMLSVLEKRANTAGLNKYQQFGAERERSLGRVGGDPQAIERIDAAYRKLINTQKQADNSALLDKARAASDRAATSAAQFQRALERQNKAIHDGIADLEKRANLAGRTAVQRLDIQRTEAIGKLGTTPEHVDRINAAYARLTQVQRDAEKSGEGLGSSLLGLAGKFGLAVGGAEAFKFILKDTLLESTLYAARTEQLGIALEAVGVANRVSAGTLAVTEQKVKSLGITTQDTRKILAQLVAAHIDLSKASELARAAQDLGRVSGLNSSETFERMTHAIVTQQPEMLRTLGLNVNLQREFERVAQKTNRAADSLSEFEKRQITTNAVLQAATAYTGVYAKSQETAGGKILSFDRYIKEAKNTLGNQFLPTLSATVSLLEWTGKNGEAAVGGFKGLLGILGPVGAGLVTINDGLLLYNELFGKEKKSDFGSVAIDKLNEGNEAQKRQQQELADQQIIKAQQIKEKLKEQSLQTDERASQFRQESLAAELGGVARVARERTKLIQESSKLIFDGQRYDATISAKALADINSGTQARIRAENRKTDEATRKLQRDNIDARYRDEQKNLQAREQVENDSLSSLEARELLGRRQTEDFRLSLHKETLRQITAIDQVVIESDLKEEIRKYSEVERLAGTSSARIGAHVEALRASAAEKQKQSAIGLTDAVAHADAELNIARQARAREYADRQKEYAFETESQRLAFGRTIIDAEKNAQLDSLQLIQAQTLESKLAVGASRLKIDTDAIERIEKLELNAIDRRTTHDIEQAAEAAIRRGDSLEQSITEGLQIEARAQQERKQLGISADIAIADAGRKTAIENAKLVVDHNRTIFEGLKSEFDRLFDAATDRSKSFTQELGSLLKGVLRTAARDAVTGPLAANVTSLITGQKVAIQRESEGAGPLGKLQSLFGYGRKIEVGGTETAIQHVTAGNALRVIVTNPVQQRAQEQGGSFNFSTILNRVGGPTAVLASLLAGLPAAAAPGTRLVEAASTATQAAKPRELIPQVTSTFKPETATGGLGRIPGIAPGLGAIIAAASAATGFSSKASSVPAGVIDSTIRYAGGGSQSFSGGVPGSFQQLAGIVGGPGGTSGFAGPVNQSGLGGGGTATGGPSGGFGGIVSGAKGQLSSLGQLFGIQGGGVFSNPGGGVFAGGGLGSKLGSIGHSTGTALIGAGLAYDGLRRGGIAGLAETTAGGAAIGFKFGGGVGALIGAGIGAAAGTVRLFVKGFAEQTREQIKQAYGIDVRDRGVLNQIVAQIKQNYGGSISLGISSPQIRDFIELYALNTKQNFGLQDKPRNINLTDVGGSLSQSASYQNGISYGLAGGTVPISGQVDRTVARPAAINVVVHNNTSISGEDVGALLEGRQIQTINNNPRIVQQAAVAASQTNSNRQSQARLGLSPFALTS